MGRILRSLVCGGEVCATLVDSSDIACTAAKYHRLSPLSGAALSRALTVGAFLSAGLKNDGDKMSFTIKGRSGDIVVCGNSALEIRGYIDDTQACLPKKNGREDVCGLIGSEGRLTVVKDIGLKEPYSGSCSLVSGNIEDDFSAYCTYSDQQPTALLLFDGEEYGGTGGVFVQAMPDCTAENLRSALGVLEKLAAMREKSPVLDIDAAGGMFGGEFEERTAVYKCICSEEYIEKLLLSMGRDELISAIKEQGKIEVACHFCDKKYTFDKADVETLLGEKF